MDGPGMLFIRRVAVAVVFVVSVASAGPASPPADRELSRAIMTELTTDESVGEHLIDVTVDSGFVRLSGTVDNMLSKDQAEKICYSLKGVRGIVNDLRVLPVQRTQKELRNAVNRAVIEDPVAEGLDLTVAVNGDTVLLKGSVQSMAEKMLVLETVKGVKGVGYIKNGITVNPVQQRSDREIKEEISGVLQSDPFVYSKMIKVHVASGVVRLTGTVGTFSEKINARLDAYVPGAVLVADTGLTVELWAKDPLRRDGKLVVKPEKTILKELYVLFKKDPRISPYKIAATMENGQVTLRGVVGTLRAKRRAKATTLRLVGVYNVANRIKVRPEAMVSDTMIEKKIRDRLEQDPVVERHELKVVVRNAKAYIYGVVDNEYERRHVAKVAEKIPGVVRVANHLDTRSEGLPRENLTDLIIKKNIKNEYRYEFLIDPSDLKVKVEDGVVTVGGAIESVAELRAIVRHALDSGAKMVVTQLLFNGRKRYGAYDYRDRYTFAVN